MVECEVVVEVEYEAVIVVFGVVVEYGVIEVEVEVEVVVVVVVFGVVVEDGVIEVEVEVEVVVVDWDVVECEVVVEVECEVVVVVFGVVVEDGVMEVEVDHEAGGVVVLALVVQHAIQCKCNNFSFRIFPTVLLFCE